MTPKPMAKGVLFRLSHLLVAEIMTLACGISAITCRFGRKAESEEGNCARVKFTQDKLLCDEAEVEVSNGWGNPRSVEH